MLVCSSSLNGKIRKGFLCFSLCYFIFVYSCACIYVDSYSPGHEVVGLNLKVYSLSVAVLEQDTPAIQSVTVDESTGFDVKYWFPV